MTTTTTAPPAIADLQTACWNRLGLTLGQVVSRAHDGKLDVDDPALHEVMFPLLPHRHLPVLRSLAGVFEAIDRRDPERLAYTMGLRRLADALDRNPDVPLPAAPYAQADTAGGPSRFMVV